MGAPVASGTLAGSTSGSGASIHREAASSDFTRSVATVRSHDSHNSADRRGVERRRRRRLPRPRKKAEGRSTSPMWRDSSAPGAGSAPSAWRLRRASDGQVRLQIAADRSASKHGGGFCNRPRASLPAGPVRGSDGDHADRLASGETRVSSRADRISQHVRITCSYFVTKQQHAAHRRSLESGALQANPKDCSTRMVPTSRLGMADEGSRVGPGAGGVSPPMVREPKQKLPLGLV
jgi:hypothetical protein